MIIFKLPDLGEGLPDAIIREWYVKVGEEVKVDQPLVAMETAKALVDVPAPYDGKIEKLFGDVGDTIETGSPLIGFEGESAEEVVADAGTVVGAIEETEEIIEEKVVAVEHVPTKEKRVKATPAVRALAKQLGVDLEKIVAKGARITKEEVEAAAKKQPSVEVAADMQSLSPVQHAMVLSMTKAHKEVVPVTLADDADIHAWTKDTDITIRLIRAIAESCKLEPKLNATFDSENLKYRLNEVVNIGIAVDTPHGLYVPVLKNVNNLDDSNLRNKINLFKQQAQDKSIPQEDLHGATIMFSNFGAFAGRYANPILVPPLVAIVGVGRSRDEVVAVNGQPAVHRILPLSITVDHRLVTGGETARFLRALINHLEQE